MNKKNRFNILIKVFTFFLSFYLFLDVTNAATPSCQFGNNHNSDVYEGTNKGSIPSGMSNAVTCTYGKYFFGYDQQSKSYYDYYIQFGFLVTWHRNTIGLWEKHYISVQKGTGNNDTGLYSYCNIDDDRDYLFNANSLQTDNFEAVNMSFQTTSSIQHPVLPLFTAANYIAGYKENTPLKFTFEHNQISDLNNSSGFNSYYDDQLKNSRIVSGHREGLELCPSNIAISGVPDKGIYVPLIISSSAVNGQNLNSYQAGHGYVSDYVDSSPYVSMDGTLTYPSSQLADDQMYVDYSKGSSIGQYLTPREYLNSKDGSQAFSEILPLINEANETKSTSSEEINDQNAQLSQLKTDVNRKYGSDCNSTKQPDGTYKFNDPDDFNKIYKYTTLVLNNAILMNNIKSQNFNDLYNQFKVFVPSSNDTSLSNSEKNSDYACSMLRAQNLDSLINKAKADKDDIEKQLKDKPNDKDLLQQLNILKSQLDAYGEERAYYLGKFPEVGEPEEIDCGSSVFDTIRTIFNIIMIIAPVMAIIFGIIDFAKASLNADEDALKKAGANFGKRVIAAVLLFLLPLIINIILGVGVKAGIIPDKSTECIKTSLTNK